MNKLTGQCWIFAALLAVVGCAPAAQEAPREVSNARSVAGETANSTSVAETVVSAADSESGSSNNEAFDDFRMGVGAVSFVLPENWEPQQSRNAVGIVLLAPDRDEWKEIGFRANIGVRTREHPGISLEQLQTFLEETLTQSVDQANAAFVEHEQLNELSLQQKRTYELRQTELDGVPALATEFTGAYQLKGKLITTQTFGLQILGPKFIYSISLTFPEQFTDEMEPIWTEFIASVQIDDSIPRTGS